MLELLDEIGREEIRVLQEINRNMGARTPSADQPPCATVRCHDLEGSWHVDGVTDVVECSAATLSRIEALGLVQSVKGQGYEESRGPDFKHGSHNAMQGLALKEGARVACLQISRQGEQVDCGRCRHTRHCSKLDRHALQGGEDCCRVRRSVLDITSKARSRADAPGRTSRGRNALHLA